MSRIKLNVVSWGTAYQFDQHDYWIKPAAEKCGYDLVEYSIYDPGIRCPRYMAEGYPGYVKRIKEGKNEFDLIHVLDHAPYMPGGEDVWATFPNRVINGLPDYLRHDRCVPVVQYCYALTWRRDLIRDPKLVPDWKDFFDVKKVPGKRSVFASPHGMIDIALHALGRDLDRALYDGALSKQEIGKQVDDAIALYDRLNDKIVWWGNQGSYEQYPQLMNGEAVMGVAYNRRIMTCAEDLDPGLLINDLRLQANPATAFLACDWWVIPKGTGKEEHANRLLECMYSDKEVLRGAAKWSIAQQNLVPVADVPLETEWDRYYLEMGTWKNRDAVAMNTRFWGQNFDWIGERWRAWSGLLSAFSAAEARKAG